MASVVIIDDEQLGINTLLALLGGQPNLEILASFTDPVEGMVFCAQSRPNVVFLDIEMPVLNGFEVARQIALASASTRIVFVTAYDEYAVKAFEVNSLDYLLKPVTPQRMQTTLCKIMAGDAAAPERIDSAFSASRALTNKVVVSVNERILLLNPADVCYFTSSGNTVTVVTPSARYPTREALSYWGEKMARFDFFRCHKSFLVNLNKVQELHLVFNSSYSIRLEGISDEVPVSRRYAAELKALIYS